MNKNNEKTVTLVTIEDSDSKKIIDELAISKRAKNFLMRKYSSPDEILWQGRYFAYRFQRPAEREKALKSINELVDAMEKAGYIRHDIKANSFGIGLLLKGCRLPIIPSSIEDFCLVTDEDGNMVIDYREGNRNYETFTEPTDSFLNGVKEVLMTLTNRESSVLSYRYGLEDGKLHTLEETGIRFHMTRERIRQIEDKGLRKMSRRIAVDGDRVFCPLL